MTTRPRRHRMTQLTLLCEQLRTPQWHDLSEPTRVEVTKLLARLLRMIHAGSPHSLHQGGGRADE